MHYPDYHSCDCFSYRLWSQYTLLNISLKHVSLNTRIKHQYEYNELFDYATNDVEKYFSFYADDAKVYFGGAVRGEVAPYHKMWTALMAAGGGVELNKLTDLQIDVVPSGDVAVATSFIDNRRREPDGTRVTAKAFQTDVWRKIDVQWKIVSLHYSVIAAE